MSRPGRGRAPRVARRRASVPGRRALVQSQIITAAADLFPDGITLNLAAPGLHATDRMKQLGGGAGPMGAPADFGKTVAFLCSEPAKFISGVALQVDGGATLGLL